MAIIKEKKIKKNQNVKKTNKRIFIFNEVL